MKKFCSVSLALGSLLLSPAARSQSAQVYPFQYFESLNVSFDAASSRVYPGVHTDLNGTDGLQVRPSNVLYVAPRKAKVGVTAFGANEFAGCAEVQNDSVVADELSSIFKEKTDQYKLDTSFTTEVQAKEIEAKRSCLAAMEAGAANAKSLCDLAKNYSSLRISSSESYASTLKELNEIREIVAKQLETYGNQYGGFATATVELWDKQEIDEVKAANPGKVVQIVPLKDEILFDFVPGLEKNSELGEVIPRRNALGFSLQGQSTRTDATGGSKEAVTQVKTGESTALGITLSRLGACSTADLKRAGTFNYKYDTFGYIRGEVSYNRFEFYKKVAKTKTKNGFFSTKTSSSVLEEMKKEQTLIISAMGDDKVAIEEMQERLEKITSESLLDLVATRSTTDVALGAELPSLEAPKAGADVAGDNLLKCPDWRCQVGGYVLKTAAAIFGQGATEASFERNWNFQDTTKYSETTLHQASGSSSAVISWNE